MTESTTRDALRFIEDAGQFCIALWRNADDNDFASRSGRIVYIVDASVISLFLTPGGDDARYVSPFKKDRESGHLALTATVTAEYIFSRALTGQRDLPCFITPHHGRDLATIVRALNRKTGMEERPEMVQTAVAALRSIYELLTSGAIDGNEAARRVTEVALNQPIISRTFELKQFLRLYNEDLLRPLASHRETTDEILKPPEELVLPWQNAISQLRGPGSSARPDQLNTAHAERDAERDRHDATSLVQTLLLNRLATRHGINVRYVLVTVDPTMHEAYSWAYSYPPAVNSIVQLADEDHHWYALRHPLQYIPLANFSEMPNSVETTEVFKQTRETIEAILRPLSGLTPKFPHTLPATIRNVLRPDLRRLPSPERVSLRLLEQVAARLEHSEQILSLEKWHNAFAGAALLNLPLLHRRSGSQLELLRKIFSQDREVFRTLLKEQQRILDSLKQAFVITGDRFDIDLMVSIAGDAAVAPQRAPPVLALELGAFGEEKVVRAVMRGAALKPPDLSGIQSSLEKCEHHFRFAFGAILAFRCSLWSIARDLAYRAVQAAPSDASGHANCRELMHLEAVAIRLSLGGSEEFNRADTLLAELIDLHRAVDDTLRCQRSMVERAVLHLTGAFSNRLLAKNIDGYLEADLDLVDRLLRHLSLSNVRPTPETEHIARMIELQTAAAVIARTLFGELFETSPGAVPSPIRRLERGLAQFKRPKDLDELPLVVRLERAMLLWIQASRAGTNKNDYRDELNQLFRKAHDTHHRGEMTALDWAEAKEFERRIGTTRHHAHA